MLYVFVFIAKRMVKGPPHFNQLCYKFSVLDNAGTSP